MRVFYNLALGALFWGLVPRLFSSKGRRRLRIDLPEFCRASERPLIWFHAVSLGEMRACVPLVEKMRERHPHAQFVFSTATTTGLQEAKERFSQADAHFLLPYDLPWLMRRLVSVIQPTLFVQVETDFWPNLLFELKRAGAKIALVNGKMSDKSARRHHLFPFFGRSLFDYFDVIALQSERYSEIFRMLTPSPLFVTGNLKLDQPLQEGSRRDELRERFGLKDRTLVIGSTHEGEEEALLRLLIKSDYQIVLAPRHPERFERVALLLDQMEIPYGRLSLAQVCGKILLIDAIGALNAFYQIADLAIVGGSFIPGVGGHNIFEPMRFGIPTFFGPYMHNQRDFATLALTHNAAIQTTLNDLMQHLDRADLTDIGNRGEALFNSSQGASEKTYALLQPFLISGCD